MNFTEMKTLWADLDPERIAFMGIGNRYRGDDAAGLEWVHRLEKQPDLETSLFIIAETTPENHLQKIIQARPRLLICIDAARWGGRPGEVKQFSPSEINTFSFSTHAYSILLIEKYLKVHIPIQIEYLGIQPLDTSLNEHLSTDVARALDSFFTDSL
jgi:hydrogenase 3 maturation protease